MKTFKIVKIIDENRVVVNAGSNDLINSDQVLEIFVPGQEVIDPDTGESLGTLDYVKAKLRVVDVFPKMCVCENNREIHSTLFSLQSIWSEKAPLNVDSKDISGGYEGINGKIRVGDLVRKVN